MYGLPKEGQLSYIALIKHLQLYGYTRAGFTPGLFKNATQDTMFSLVVYDSGVKYTAKNDAFHLIGTLQKKYPIIIDWSDRIFLGIHLDWDYINLTVILSMPNYVNKDLSILQNKKPKHDQHSPHPQAKPNNGAKIQYVPPSTNYNLTK